MTTSSNPLTGQFMATAEDAVRLHPETDADMIREIFAEAASVLHNGLAFDGLDDHDTDAVLRGVCAAMLDPDPGAGLRAASRACADDPDLHDAKAVAASYLIAAGLLQV